MKEKWKERKEGRKYGRKERDERKCKEI